MDSGRAMAMALFCALAGCGTWYGGSSPPAVPPPQDAAVEGFDSLTEPGRRAFEAGGEFRIVNRLEGDALLLSASYLPDGARRTANSSFGLHGLDVSRRHWFRVGANISMIDAVNMPMRIALSPDQRLVVTGGTALTPFEGSGGTEARWRYKASFGFPPNWVAKHGRDKIDKEWNDWHLLVVTDVVTSEPVAVFDYEDLFPGYRSPGLETIAQYSFGPDGRWIYYNGEEDRNNRDPKSYSAMIWRVHVKDRTRAEVLRTPPSELTGIAPFAFVKDDPSKIFAMETTPERKGHWGQAFIYDLERGARSEIRTTPENLYPTDIRGAARTGRAVWVDERGMVVTDVADDGSYVQKAKHPELAGRVWGTLRVSPDGRWAIFSREHTYRMWLYLYDTETGEFQWILRPIGRGSFIEQGVWSDDGRYFAGYIGTARAEHHLIVIDLHRREIGFFGRHEYALALAFITKPDVIEAIRARSRAYGEPQFVRVNDRHVRTSRYGLSDWYASVGRPFFGGWMKPDTPEADGGGWTIDTIMDRSPPTSFLEGTGLRKEDRLVTIDGERPANAEACWTKLEDAILKADRVVLGIQRGADEPMEFTVEIVEALPVPE